VFNVCRIKQSFRERLVISVDRIFVKNVKKVNLESAGCLSPGLKKVKFVKYVTLNIYSDKTIYL
jgi:hypothetical protein